MNRARKRIFGMVGLGLLVLMPAAAGAVVIGKGAHKVQGRWLDIAQPVDLNAYGTVALGQVTSKIHWKKAGKVQPIDEQILVSKIQEHLGINLRRSMMFRQVLTAAPPPGTPGVLRLDCDLQVEPGSRAARYLVGMGAGKSKSVLEIQLRDHASGRQIGRYHGYGTGSGLGFKLMGGGARKMTQDDIQENTKKFVELLKRVMPPSRPAGGPIQASAPAPAPQPATAIPAPQPATATPTPQPAAPRVAALELHGVKLSPETVAPGGKLGVTIDLTLTDPVISVGQVAASVSYAIQSGGESIFTAPPREIAVSVGERTRKSLEISTGTKPGLYTLVVTVFYGSLQEAGAGTFEIG